MSEFAQRIARAWTRESAMDPVAWTPENPAKDQCAVTAAFLWERLRLPVVRGRAILPDGTIDSHYWNEGVDLTRLQYPAGTRIEVRQGPQGEDAYDYLMSNPDLVRRLEIFRLQFDTA